MGMFFFPGLGNLLTIALTLHQMMRSRQSLQEPLSHPQSPADEDLESEHLNGYEDELRGRTGEGVSTSR